MRGTKRRAPEPAGADAGDKDVHRCNQQLPCCAQIVCCDGRLAYAVEQIRRPAGDFTCANATSCPEDVQRVIDRLKGMDANETRRLRDEQLETLRRRNGEMRASTEFQRWKEGADAQTAAVRGGTNGPLLIQLLAEAGHDVSRLRDVLGTGKRDICLGVISV